MNSAYELFFPANNFTTKDLQLWCRWINFNIYKIVWTIERFKEIEKHKLFTGGNNAYWKSSWPKGYDARCIRIERCDCTGIRIQTNTIFLIVHTYLRSMYLTNVQQ